MITVGDLYHVMTAVVPLYVAMILAYGSVKWWKIFSPDQCSGINRFVALFAVPLLSFHFISTNNPYTMSLRFIAADTLQKLLLLAALTAWANLSRRGSLEWAITLFSLSTLPNTLVMGIPLLRGMYGDFSGSLMVQIVVLQCIIWYTLLLFLFEFRSARLLISQQFPLSASSIASIAVDSDVLSLDARLDPLEADSELLPDGKLRVTVRRSNASRSDVFSRRSHAFSSSTPRPSNLSNAEIYSLHSSRNPTPRGSSFNHSDFYSLAGRPSNFGPSDAFGAPRSTNTPRPSNYDEDQHGAAVSAAAAAVAAAAAAANNNPAPVSNNKPRYHYQMPAANGVGGHYPAPNPCVFNPVGPPPPPPKPAAGGGRKANGQAGHLLKAEEGGANKDLHMFVWSSSASPVSDVFGNNVQEHGLHASDPGANAVKDVRVAVSPTKGREGEYMGEQREEFSFGNRGQMMEREGGGEEEAGTAKVGRGTAMPPTSVMTRLIMIMVWRKLIRNPNTYSSLIGLTWSLVSFRWHVEMPAIISHSISILSDAGLGMAMFSLGLFMALQPRIIACGNRVACFSMAVRFLAGPAVMAAASFAVGLRGVLLHVAIVQAALPQGIVPFVFSKEYNVHPDILSTGVIFGMLIALPITLLYYIVMGL